MEWTLEGLTALPYPGTSVPHVNSSHPIPPFFNIIFLFEAWE